MSRHETKKPTWIYELSIHSKVVKKIIHSEVGTVAYMYKVWVVILDIFLFIKAKTKVYI